LVNELLKEGDRPRAWAIVSLASPVEYASLEKVPARVMGGVDTLTRLKAKIDEPSSA